MSADIELTAIPTDPEAYDGFQEMTRVPDAIVELYAEKDHQVFFTYGGPVATTRASAYRCLPVLAKDIEDIPEDERLRILLEFEPIERTGGLLKRGDAVLVSQPYAARDYYRGEAERRRLAQEDATDASSEQLEELLKENLGGKPLPRGLVTIPPGTGAKVADQAIGGPEIQEILRHKRGGRKE